MNFYIVKLFIDISVQYFIHTAFFKDIIIYNKNT